MDWPTAAVCIAAIAALVAVHIANRMTETDSTEAIGFIHFDNEEAS